MMPAMLLGLGGRGEGLLGTVPGLAGCLGAGQNRLRVRQLSGGSSFP